MVLYRPERASKIKQDIRAYLRLLGKASGTFHVEQIASIVTPGNFGASAFTGGLAAYWPGCSQDTRYVPRGTLAHMGCGREGAF